MQTECENHARLWGGCSFREEGRGRVFHVAFLGACLPGELAYRVEMVYNVEASHTADSKATQCTLKSSTARRSSVANRLLNEIFY